MDLTEGAAPLSDLAARLKAHYATNGLKYDIERTAFRRANDYLC